VCKKICIDRYVPSQKGIRAVGFFKKYWQRGQTLKIKFLGGTAQQHDFVRATAEKWLQYANLRFEWVTGGETHIRIAFDARDGAWSYLGTDCLEIPVDQPTMNLGWVDESVVLHEFGHALGLGHEHQNPQGGIKWNEQAVVKDLSGYPNYWDYATIKHNVLDRYDHDEVVGTTVDPDSIMMYPIPNAWTLDTFQADFNETLSPVDKMFIATVYPKTTTVTDPTDPVNPTLEFARKLFLTKRELAELDEKTVVRLGQMLGLKTDERKYSKKTNCRIVEEILFK
jgi:hypothetical protein